MLSTVGVVVTAVLTGFGPRALFHLPWLEAVLLGSVVASTDAAAVFTTLRSTHVDERIAGTLEAESGGNDPMAIALTSGFIAWVQRPATYGFWDLALLVVRQLGLGLVIGVAVGCLARWTLPRLPEAIASFSAVASIAVVAIAFGAADVAGGADSLRSTSPASPSETRRRATDDSSWRSTRASRSSPRSRSSSFSGSSSFRVSCGAWPVTGSCSRSYSSW